MIETVEGAQPDSAAATRPVAFIAGASGLYGRALTRVFHQAGYRLALHAHTRPDAWAEAPELAIHADFRDPEAIAGLGKRIQQELGRLDVYVHAAGAARDRLLAAQPAAEVRETLDLDLKAPMLLCKALGRLFLKQKSGCVIFLGSHAGQHGRAGGAAYAMAHAGLLAFTKSLAREWGPSGVRVNAVTPPFTPGAGLGRDASEKFIEHAERAAVLKNLELETRLEQTAQFVLHLAGSLTVSGQIVNADCRL
jgi:3-oxoacyl-[acyl-carrier protein] reductase